MTERHENLLAAYFANQLSEAEKAEFLSLLDTDEEFSTRFREMEAAYVAACIPAFEKTKEADYRRLEKQIRPRRILVSFWRPAAIAAGLADKCQIQVSYAIGVSKRRVSMSRYRLSGQDA